MVAIATIALYIECAPLHAGDDLHYAAFDSAFDRWLFYKDHSDEWRWKHFDARNGREIGASSESYKNRLACIENAKRHGYGVELTERDCDQIIRSAEKLRRSVNVYLHTGKGRDDLAPASEELFGALRSHK